MLPMAAGLIDNLCPVERDEGPALVIFLARVPLGYPAISSRAIQAIRPAGGTYSDPCLTSEPRRQKWHSKPLKNVDLWNAKKKCSIKSDANLRSGQK